MRHPIIISFGEDEYLPILTSVGHNLKEANLFFCESENITKSKNFLVIHKKITLINDCVINLLVTYKDNELVRGFLYYNDREFKIVDTRSYNHLQIGKYSYDLITGIRLEENLWLDNVA